VLVVIEHHSRRLIHFNVTAHPTAQWTRQQLREAVGYEERYAYLLHDRDSIFSAEMDQSIQRLGLRVLKSPPRVGHPVWSGTRKSIDAVSGCGVCRLLHHRRFRGFLRDPHPGVSGTDSCTRYRIRHRDRPSRCRGGSCCRRFVVFRRLVAQRGCGRHGVWMSDCCHRHRTIDGGQGVARKISRLE
jgi:hypothetical protein